MSGAGGSGWPSQEARPGLLDVGARMRCKPVEEVPGRPAVRVSAYLICTGSSANGMINILQESGGQDVLIGL